MAKAKHLLIDCRDVAPEVCLDDGRVLDVLARACREAGATVLSQVRYHFGHNSLPGFAVVVLLDESHCSAHCYADTREIAMDLFTCGSTDPWHVLELVRQELDLGTVTVSEVVRFTPEPHVVRTLSEHPV